MDCAHHAPPFGDGNSTHAAILSRQCSFNGYRIGVLHNQGNNDVSRSSSGNRSAYVIKLPKVGGDSFVASLVVWNCDAYGNAARIAWGERGDGLLDEVAAGTGLFVILRDLQEHVLSMYAHCQRGESMSNLHHAKTNLSNWLGQTSEQQIWPSEGHTCDYYPFNFQTGGLWQASRGALPNHIASWRVLSADPAGSLEHALCTVRRARFVGVTEHMRESLCVASYALHGHLPPDGRCSCDRLEAVESQGLVQHKVGESRPGPARPG